jgi:adenine/guanine phosphoribosyltransferase-like PRPP-binding protein
LSGAFVASVPVEGTRVVLIDDVLTSGVTAAECAEVLRRAGAAEVGVLTAARSLGGPIPARCYNPARFPPGSVVARGRFSR